MGLKRDKRGGWRRDNPAWGKALLDWALALAATTAIIVAVRAMAGGGMASFESVGYAAFFLAALVLAAYRHGVTPRSYWRNRRDPAWPPSGVAQRSNRTRLPI